MRVWFLFLTINFLIGIRTEVCNCTRCKNSSRWCLGQIANSPKGSPQDLRSSVYPGSQHIGIYFYAAPD